MLQLKVRGYPSLEVAEDSVSEWLCGRLDGESGLLASRFGRAVRGFDPKKGSFRAFLLEDLRLFVSGTVVRRLVADSRHDPIDSVMIEDPRSNFRVVISVREVTRVVMESLNDNERRILSLANEGHTIGEIAERLKTSPCAVKTAICRARRHARDELVRLNHTQRTARPTS